MTEDPFYVPLYMSRAGMAYPLVVMEGYKPRHRADKDHRNRGRSSTHRAAYVARAVRPEASWGALDDYSPRHRA